MSDLDRLDSRLMPDVGRRIKLVKIEGEDRDAKRVTFRGYSGYAGGLSLLATGVDAKEIPRLLNCWPEANRLVARVETVMPGVCVALAEVTWHEYRLCDDLATRRVAHRDWFCVVDPSEVKHVDIDGAMIEQRSAMFWGDGTIERFNHMPQASEALIEAHRLLGELYAMQRIDAIAQKDGDHAIGTRVARFLIPPEYLLKP